MAQTYHSATGRRLPSTWRRRVRRLAADPAEAELLATVTAATWQGCEHWRSEQRNPLHPGIGTLLVYLRHRTPPQSGADRVGPGGQPPVAMVPVAEAFRAQVEATRERWLAEARLQRPDLGGMARLQLAGRLWHAATRAEAGREATR